MKNSVQLNIRWRYFLSAIGGALYFLGFVGFDQWYLSWFCLVPLFFALEGVSVRQGLFLGWFFGTVALTGGFYWITHTIHVFAFMPWAVSILGCILLSVAQATEFALFALVYTWLRKRTASGAVFLGTIAFVSAEFVSPQLFPHYLANSQYMNIPLIQICDITGVAGVSALLVLVNATIYVLMSGVLRGRRFVWKPLLLAVGVVCAVMAYGYLRLPAVASETDASPKIRFGIAQANMGIYEKVHNPEKAIRLNQEQTLKLKEMGAEIVIWPETAVQRPLLRSGESMLPQPVFDNLGIPILTGALERGSGVRPPIYNVAVLTDANGKITGSYIKQKLLMLGEYIPLGETFPVVYGWFPYIGRLTPGNSNKPIGFQEYLLGVNICYEDILPRLINKMAKESPDVFVNLTNDNWFGYTHEPLQHLVLAAFRSVEHRRWLVRSTNTGISAFVDATGRIVERSPLMEESILISDVPMMKGKTIYARLGDWFSWLMLLAVCVKGVIKGLSI